MEEESRLKLSVRRGPAWLQRTTDLVSNDHLTHQGPSSPDIQIQTPSSSETSWAEAAPETTLQTQFGDGTVENALGREDTINPSHIQTCHENYGDELVDSFIQAADVFQCSTAGLEKASDGHCVMLLLEAWDNIALLNIA